ncbi:NAD binding domain of 6-phosphogluconate dehydrogenase-domain-containing protein [Coprinopsis sp. MPI-PUGE-AT-0042]|nr:NAD binding domain of 6-phosphogluconate dehydrogenase-domain-containing protein [Coprinopsis sp. MPI-PUGE-AT-0042]
MAALSPPTMSNAGSIPFSRPGSPGAGHVQVGFVGLGNIGAAMARNLVTRGPQNVHGLPPPMLWNRTLSKAHDLAKEVGNGLAIVAETVEELVRECDVIVMNLANDDVVLAMYQQFAQVLQVNTSPSFKYPPSKRKILVETSTIFPTLAGELDKIVSVFPHTHLITCPVLGATPVAQNAGLLFIMAGEHHSKKQVAHILVPSVGRKVLDLGGDVEKASAFKLMANSMVLGTMEVMAEAITLSEKAGIGSQRVFDLIQDFFPAPGMVKYAKRMVTEDFDASSGFSLDGGIKDATHIRNLSAKYHCPMPTIDVAHQHLVTARALYQKQKNEGKATVSEMDWSSLIAGTRTAAGLDGFDRSNDGSLVEDTSK